MVSFWDSSALHSSTLLTTKKIRIVIPERQTSGPFWGIPGNLGCDVCDCKIGGISFDNKRHGCCPDDKPRDDYRDRPKPPPKVKATPPTMLTTATILDKVLLVALAAPGLLQLLALNRSLFKLGFHVAGVCSVSNVTERTVQASYRLTFCFFNLESV